MALDTNAKNISHCTGLASANQSVNRKLIQISTNCILRSLFRLLRGSI